MDQTVTLLSYDFAGSNPALPTFYEKYFVSFKISFKFANRLPTNFVNKIAEVAQLVERQPSKLNVASSTLVFRSKKITIIIMVCDFFLNFADLAQG